MNLTEAQLREAVAAGLGERTTTEGGFFIEGEAEELTDAIMDKIKVQAMRCGK